LVLIFVMFVLIAALINPIPGSFDNILVKFSGCGLEG